MPVSDDFLEFIKDQLQSAGEVIHKRMFGGAGLYLRGLFFALVSDDTLYFKVADLNREDFESAGMKPFKPFPDKATVMNYWEVPADILEDYDLLAEWAEKALLVAEKAAGNKNKNKK